MLYYSGQSDRVLEKLGRNIAKESRRWLNGTSALDMLFDMKPERVTQSIIYLLY